MGVSCSREEPVYSELTEKVHCDFLVLHRMRSVSNIYSAGHKKLSSPVKRRGRIAASENRNGEKGRAGMQAPVTSGSAHGDVQRHLQIPGFWAWVFCMKVVGIEVTGVSLMMTNCLSFYISIPHFFKSFHKY